MPIIHDLALHFEQINLDWVSRDNNYLADKAAKMGAERINVTNSNPDLFNLAFRLS
jgi:hypothetical protein